MKFSGYLLNNHFELTEAASPIDLYGLWYHPGDPPIEELRCWVLLNKTPHSTVWVEVVLELPSYFDGIKTHLGDEVLIEFRRKGSSSPNNTSPHASPAKASEGGTVESLQMEESGTLGITESLSTQGLELTNTCTNSTSREINASELINVKDPFTMEDVQSIEDPIYLRFPKKTITVGEDILCVSLESFENFVRSEADAGKNLIDLELNRVMCKDGREHSFIITKSVWLLSILESPQNMRTNFRDYLKCSILRENQLKVLKEDESMRKRIHYWVSDLLDFTSAEARLSVPVGDDLCPFMSPYYFTSEEAKLLGNLLMPNTTDLKTTMTIMLEEKASGGAVEVCASHDIAPVLMIGFMIKKGFHKQDRFKNDKKAWIKSRDKEMKKKK